ncbi:MULTISPECIES: hypothetical protein [unclassified Chelatococcus]|uniref:hypothetical protein n=1 Tax=unclassified Chelatococcus TaxID=2638111 RepID=UPI001BCDF6EF|nr:MULTISPECIES: hypothetical protein [unclassified Chelatococcus]MBS7698673.1 hypothetical protein [Chelatococcus sp. YT9]MBX3554745.1 hypothetical protein [Chelatococcus sp.]
MLEIKLSELTGNGEVRNLSGHERGLAARKKFQLEAADERGEEVLVVVPHEVYTLTPSFFQGMFAESVRRAASREKFLARYRFDADPVVLRQVESGISASLMRRGSILAA